MKIWITRLCAGALISGGLDGVQVWFKKPIWRTTWRTPDEDQMPWPPDMSDLNGRAYSSWEASRSGTGPVSFGKMFGFNDRKCKSEDDLSLMIWDRLCTHFGTQELRDWKESSTMGRALFIIELDIQLL